MECPRCGEPLATYALGDTETVACENCTYVGVTVDHRPESQETSESWSDALARFRRTGDDASAESGGDKADGDESDGDESDGP